MPEPSAGARSSARAASRSNAASAGSRRMSTSTRASRGSSSTRAAMARIPGPAPIADAEGRLGQAWEEPALQAEEHAPLAHHGERARHRLESLRPVLSEEVGTAED